MVGIGGWVSGAVGRSTFVATGVLDSGGGAVGWGEDSLKRQLAERRMAKQRITPVIMGRALSLVIFRTG